MLCVWARYRFTAQAGAFSPFDYSGLAGVHTPKRSTLMAHMVYFPMAPINSLSLEPEVEIFALPESLNSSAKWRTHEKKVWLSS